MSRMRKTIWTVILVSFFAFSEVSAQAEDWPRFRGPSDQGHSQETALPLSWSESENIGWKTAIPGLGWSSPSLLGNRIWLTTALEDGKSLRAICIARDSGKILVDQEVFALESPGPIHSKNSHASPTPLLEGNRVYVHFGAHGTACLSDQGKILWKVKFEYAHQHGPGGSPVIYDDLLIVACDGTDQQFVAALNKKTGEEVWRTKREGAMAYSTPLVISVNGKDQLVSACGEWVVAYEPLTGDEIWKVRYPTGYSNVPRPVFGQGLVFVCSGYDSPELYAIRPDGSGDVTDTHVAWMMDRGAPLNPSPILVDARLYVFSDNGIASCLNATTGEEVWRERLGGAFSASPVFAAGRIYIQNEEGTTYVLKPGDTFEKLAENKLEGRTLATLSPSNGAIYLRTDTHLYQIKE